jgi:MFS family permease
MDDLIAWSRAAGKDYRRYLASPGEEMTADYRRLQETRRSQDEDYLTPFERQVVTKITVLGVVSTLTEGLLATALAGKLMSIANNDPIAIAKANGIHWSANAALQLLLRPLGAAASDRFGRKIFIVANQLTMIARYAGCFFMTSLDHYVAACIISSGLLSPLTTPGETATWSDVFGERPELSARVRAKYTTLSGAISSLIFPLLGAYVNHKSLQSSHRVLGRGNLGFVLAIACAVAQTAYAFTFPETCPDEKGRAALAAIGQIVAERKPFSLLIANPVSSSLILFRNGPGLRGLAISHIWYVSVGTVSATMEPYRLSYIGWSPSQQSMYDSMMGGIRVPLSIITQYLLKRMGNRRSYLGNALASGIGHVIIGQSVRPHSAGLVRKTAQFASGDVLEHVFTNPLEDMILKQGRTVTNHGIAQIQAAGQGIGSIVGIVSPIFWSWLFEFFASRPHASTIYLLIGPGGHFVVAGICRLLAAHSCWRIKDEDLFIADSDDVVAIKQQLGLPGADYRRSVLPDVADSGGTTAAGRARIGSHGFQLPVLATDEPRGEYS